MKSSKGRSVISDSWRPHGIYSPWNSPGQNTGVGSQSLLQQIFLTQELNWGFLHCRWILYQLSHEGNPEKVINEIINSWLPGGKHRRKEFGVDTYTVLSSSSVEKNLPAMEETRVASLGGKTPWRGKWLPTPVFLPWKAYGQRSLGGYSPWGHRRVRHDLKTTQQQHV